MHICICAGEFPSHLLHVHIDVNLAGFELGKVCRHEGAILLMLFLGCGKPCGHPLDLLAQRLDLCVLFPEQAFLLFDFLCVYDDTLCRDFCFLKLAFFVIGAVAIVHPLDELKKPLQGSEGIAGLYAALRVDGQVAQFDDKRQLAPCVVVHGETECRLMNQCL